MIEHGDQLKQPLLLGTALSDWPGGRLASDTDTTIMAFNIARPLCIVENYVIRRCLDTTALSTHTLIYYTHLIDFSMPGEKGTEGKKGALKRN